MKSFKFIFVLILAVVGLSIPGKNHAAVNQEMADSILAHLSPGTSTDTIRQLYDAFDLSSWKQRGEVGWRILNVARRSKHYGVMCDQLLQLSSIYKSDSLSMNKLMKILEELPDGDRKKGVRLFMKVEGVTGEATFLSPEERNKKLMTYLKEDMHQGGDIYEDVFDLYRIVLFLGKESKGNMYHEYMDRLEKVIQELPEDYYIKNLFYTTAAIFYTQNNYPDKAIACDRKLLEQIDKLEAIYAEEGRKYRNYDRFNYICYRRMLSNYSALTLAEVQDLYNRCEKLAESDDEVNRDFAHGRVKAYKKLAEKDYAGAIPYLKLAVKNNKDAVIHRELVGALVAAADSVGDNATLLSALKDYNRMLAEEQKLKSQEALREMQIRYDVNSLQQEKNDLEIEKRDLELAHDQKIIIIVLVSLLGVAIVLMLVCRGYFRLKSDKRILTDENAKLKNSLENYLRDGKPAGTKDLRGDFDEITGE